MKNKCSSLEIINSFLRNIDSNFIYHVIEDERCGCIYIIEKNGKAILKSIWFGVLFDRVYLDVLSVIESERRKGLGSRLLNIHIMSIKEANCYSIVSVKYKSWMHDWFLSKGYDKDPEGDIRGEEDESVRFLLLNNKNN